MNIKKIIAEEVKVVRKAIHENDIAKVLFASKTFHKMVNETVAAVRDAKGNLIVGTQVPVTPGQQGSVPAKPTSTTTQTPAPVPAATSTNTATTTPQATPAPTTTPQQPAAQNAATTQPNGTKPVQPSEEENEEIHENHEPWKSPSGEVGWKGKLTDQFSSLEEFEDYDEIYSLAQRLGYDDATSAWMDNPTIHGSTNPEDYGKELNEWLDPDWYQRDPNNVSQEKVTWEQMSYIAQDYTSIYNTAIQMFRQELHHGILSKYLVERIASAVGIPRFNTSENIHALTEFFNEKPDDSFIGEFDNQYLIIFFGFKIQNFNGWNVDCKGAIKYKINGERCGSELQAKVSKVPKIEEPEDSTLSAFKKVTDVKTKLTPPKGGKVVPDWRLGK